MLKRILILGLMIVLAGGASWGAIPPYISFSGKLTGPSPMPSSINVRFTITGNGSDTSTKTDVFVDTDTGVFSTMIDITDPSIFNTATVPTLQVDIDPERDGSYIVLSPPQNLVSVPYAYRAAVADEVVGGGGVSLPQRLETETDLADFGSPQLSGFYGKSGATGDVPDTAHSWSHLLNLRHRNADNHHAMQIAGSYAENDRFFFRKIANASVVTENPSWNEFATRGQNTFTGDQIINGKVGIGTMDPAAKLEAITDDFNPTIYGKNTWDGMVVFGTEMVNVGVKGESNTIGVLGVGPTAGKFEGNVLVTGDVGIGTTDPAAKLDVLGWTDAPAVRATSRSYSEAAVYAENIQPMSPALEIGDGLIKTKKYIYDLGLLNSPAIYETPRFSAHAGTIKFKVTAVGGGKRWVKVFNGYVREDSQVLISAYHPETEGINKLWIKEQSPGVFLVVMDFEYGVNQSDVWLHFLVIN